MEKVKKNDVIKAKVTGVQKYGAFVNSEDNNYDGLIHISEISYGYVKNVNDYLKIGDSIYAEVVEVSDKDNQLKLSIKDIDYKKDGTKLKRMAETKNGFTLMEMERLKEMPPCVTFLEEKVLDYTTCHPLDFQSHQDSPSPLKSAPTTMNTTTPTQPPSMLMSKLL